MKYQITLDSDKFTDLNQIISKTTLIPGYMKTTIFRAFTHALKNASFIEKYNFAAIRFHSDCDLVEFKNFLATQAITMREL